MQALLTCRASLSILTCFAVIAGWSPGACVDVQHQHADKGNSAAAAAAAAVAAAQQRQSEQYQQQPLLSSSEGSVNGSVDANREAQ
jgi:hypothetical protein